MTKRDAKTSNWPETLTDDQLAQVAGGAESGISIVRMPPKPRQPDQESTWTGAP